MFKGRDSSQEVRESCAVSIYSLSSGEPSGLNRRNIEITCGRWDDNHIPVVSNARSKRGLEERRMRTDDNVLAVDNQCFPENINRTLITWFVSPYRP
ncbi:hypothetical protein PAXRUDRAFT_825465 [Paxillus rubicundulus Ve08.2h10]|uniref:Uncharacterized protein n=1 Tax=Paxillus rubicundulus Ve08.2h10 TaxID=930991 RepID=A0A0D0E642_9AGAM|nr:hypothetical protein PAXRUDRAFT_825465 [Paxillus rubicundulus Ve08.2h10]